VSVDVAEVSLRRQLSAEKGKKTRANAHYLEMKTSELLVRGYTIAEICSELDVTKTTGYKMIKRVTDEWRRSAMSSINEVKAKELAKLDHIESAAWEGWERSKQSRRKQTIDSDILKLKDNPALRTPRKSKSVEEDRDGDPRYLDMILKCVDRRIRILGIDDMSGEIRGDTDDRNDLSKRLATYDQFLVGGTHQHLHLGTTLISEKADSLRDGADESVDSDGPPSQASTIFDVVGRIRESTP